MIRDDAGNSEFEINGFNFRAPKVFWHDGQKIIAKIVQSGLVNTDGEVDVSLFSEDAADAQNAVIAYCLIKNGDRWVNLRGQALDLHMEEVIKEGYSPMEHYGQLFENSMMGLVGDFLGQGAAESPQANSKAKQGKNSDQANTGGALKETLKRSPKKS